MLSKETLRKKFFHSLAWNGFSYGIYKVSFVSLSFTLYNVLSTNKFSSWALTNSTIFLLLLWLDCGLRKSIPRYSPVFAKNDRLHRHFIRGVIAFQALLLTFVGIPLLLILLKYFLPGYYFYILWRYATLLFITEGMVALLRLVYHAHFLQKYFNLMYAIGVIIEIILHSMTLYSSYSSKRILIQILVNKAAVSSGVIVSALGMLHVVYVTKLIKNKNHEYVDSKEVFPSFFKHSFMMWLLETAKSLSERNFLLLFFTQFLGPGTAHIFKLSQDTALLLQRIVLKTIGISDTSLLSYAEEETNSKKFFREIFSTLLRTVFFLCIMLLPFVFFTFLRFSYLAPHRSSLFIFSIFIFGYLIELVLSPYERILETKKDYSHLFRCYTPYIFCLIIGISLLSFKIVSLMLFLYIVQGSRIISIVAIAYVAHKNYLQKTTLPL